MAVKFGIKSGHARLDDPQDARITRAASRVRCGERRIEKTLGNRLTLTYATLYPALFKLEQEGAVTAEWRLSENNRRARYYSLYGGGAKQLAREAREWNRTPDLIAAFLAPRREALTDIFARLAHAMQASSRNIADEEPREVRFGARRHGTAEYVRVAWNAAQSAEALIASRGLATAAAAGPRPARPAVARGGASDIKHVRRALLQSREFAAVVAITPALAIGVNTLQRRQSRDAHSTAASTRRAVGKRRVFIP